jgi:hypothetical protein
MKKLIISCFAVACLAASCPNKQTIAYNTLYSVETSTTAAYDSYLTAVVKGNISTNNLHKISEDFNSFQLMMKAATLVVAGDTNAPAPPNLVASSTALIGEISTAK